MKKYNQIIKCDVNNCKYNDEVDCLCNLDKVDITCTCNKNKCDSKIETICNSFEEKNK